MWKVVVLLAAILLVATHAHAQSDKTVRKCGTMLGDFLDQLCNNTYPNNHLLRKKSVEVAEPVLDEDPLFPEGNGLSSLDDAYLLLRKRPAATYGLFRRLTRGVADECCRRSCRISDMLQYCARS